MAISTLCVLSQKHLPCHLNPPSYVSFPQSSDTYRHIEEEEMKKVEDAVNAKRAWMNTKQHACSQAAKHSDPTVRSSEIRAEKSVSELVA